MHQSHQVCISVIFEIWAHTKEPTTDRHNLDGLSSGNRCVINEAYPTQPGWSFFYKILPFKLLNPSVHPHTFTTPPISLPFQLPKSLPLSTDHCSPKILQIPKSYHLLVGVADVGVFLITKYLSILFFSNSHVCVSNFY